jgi:YebC/PmpR family DNA-binding regulatory protein
MKEIAMAGHSAWKNIKHRKAAVDKKRGKVWSKCSRAIIVAAQKGGGDPHFNPSLRIAVDAARAANMPRETIEKAIKKGTGEGSGEGYAVRYEGYGPGGVAMLVECLIANANKTAADIRVLLDKNGGKLGVPGSVSFGFAQKAQLIVIDGATEERLMECALDVGAEDIEGDDGTFQVLGAPADLIAIRTAIEAAGMKVESAEIIWLPLQTVQASDEVARAIERITDALEDHDDVQRVYTNLA